MVVILLVLSLMVPAYGFDFSHSAFTRILQQDVVTKGAASEIRYSRLKQNAPALDSYLRQLESVSAQQFSTWNQKQQYIFWVNAYNAYTLKLIIDHYPVKSIKKIGGWFHSPWKKKFFTLLGKKRHLDEIEHRILRVQFMEPRTHFVLNCASIGCPALRNEAYTPEQLAAQLEDQTKTFLRDISRNRIEGNKLLISKIFDWFEEDFTRNGQTVQQFIAPYISDDPAVKQKLAKGEFPVKYLSYDWGLNEFQSSP